jgi:mRNA-degrading endonuclease RelE of RelBE toxin-antitoxin system
MVRCEEFYKYFEKKGNFCGKSEVVVKKVEEYIDYVKRNKIGGYRVSNCAIDPFISIEFIKDGRVHTTALKDLKALIKKGKILPEKITRRVSIELINTANEKVGDVYKLDSIPGIRSRMRGYEHEIGEVEHEVRNMFDAVKKDIGAKNNNEAMKVMLEVCIRNPDVMKSIKEEMNNMEESEKKVEIITTQ